MVNGDKLAIDGMAVAHLYYLDEERCIRHTEYKIPYTKVIELRTAPITPTVCVSQSVEYFNCRAVSQRRLDMRGAVTMAIKVTSQGEEEVVCDATGMGMQLCHDRVENIKIQMCIRDRLYPIGDGYIADTPGFSAVELERYEIIFKEELEDCFPEFKKYLGKCQFTGCSHTVEKGCAVIQGVNQGEIPPSRHKSYCTMYEDAKKIKEWEVRKGQPDE